MKKLFSLMLIMTSFVLFFASCSKDENKDDSEDYPSIIGTWYEETISEGDYVSSTMEVIWTFNVDNTCSQRLIFTMNDKVLRDIENDFSYIYNGETIQITTEKGDVIFYEVQITGDLLKMGNDEDGYFNLTRKK